MQFKIKTFFFHDFVSLIPIDSMSFFKAFCQSNFGFLFSGIGLVSMSAILPIREVITKDPKPWVKLEESILGIEETPILVNASLIVRSVTLRKARSLQIHLIMVY